MVGSWYWNTVCHLYDKVHNAEVIRASPITDRWVLNIRPQDLSCHVRFELRTGEKIAFGNILADRVDNLQRLPSHLQLFIPAHSSGALEAGCPGVEKH
ncbi:hypothetical protein PTNB73_08951 [Pyrenophora teres f. teres]|uniref:Uncharacterized protein n=1 Tax=Pyrenophora teres f. teres TaxID=97479 RepID=A0A6S6WDK5_9PLEO|nr:hypothetical protein HRS9139_09174 [Pyrenophora teres f. teres]KAE8855048.1 hypothetical protein PTNB29_09299 [Pyrenophora teres f. teres]KAE8857703.1 hypothetical protein PTNB73_08951 [Pyrenophora teres f. teres]CAE7212186.1 hypothetical protein PTTW11_10267 [Pyrenophora teres f. teres]